ncbi:MAG TPA: cytochrome c maturation protein CcmE [Chitinophagaceae bacterium]|nr:cytochrome c maturation protein CcmE [Chitinophagaceae bacterium]
MKKIHIILLIVIAASIAVLISFMGNLSTYETIASAKQKPGKYVTLSVKMDKSQPMVYDPVKDPNYLAFTAQDTLGNTVRVVYHNSKPTDMEKSERIVIGGVMNGNQFDCKKILVRCPSKYKDDPNAAKSSLQEQTSQY